MKTIKVIDFLHQTAEGKNFDNCKMKIKSLKEMEFESVNEYVIYNKLYEEDITLNDEIEIIEEEKEIEKLDKLYILEGNNSAMPSTLQDFNNQDIAKKINELIDAVNKLRKEYR